MSSYRDFHRDSIVMSRCQTANSIIVSDLRRGFPFITDINRHNSYGMQKGVLNSKAIYNPARHIVYPRYTHSDWNLSNTINYNQSDKDRFVAERLRRDAWRTVQDIDVRTRNRQKDATRKLRERIVDITLMKEELANEINNMQVEIENLKEYKSTLERTLEDSARPLSIGQECLLQREKRYGIDMVHDDVEKNLIKEVDVIKRCQEKIRRILGSASAQLKMNRASQHNMEIDMKDKQHAQNIDDRVHQLRNSSAGIGYYPGVEAICNTVSVPESWGRYSQDNLIRSQKERANSEKLRGDMDACLRYCANSMWNQFNAVNNSFNCRIQEMTDSRNKMQSHLQKTMQEIFDTEKSVDLLRKAIQMKEGPMKVAQTRLEERNHRISVELCNDHAMKTLQREVNEIRDSVRILRDKLRSGETALARLAKTRSNLENDIKMKENSLTIDQKLCMGMRKGFPMDPKVGPIFQMPIGM